MNPGDDMFQEFNKHLMNVAKPSVFFNQISEEAVFQAYPFRMLYRLKQTEQSPEHHPEGNAWNHTMLVLDHAAEMKKKSKDPAVFMWAALLHDIGKPDTTRLRKGKITSYDHDKVGYELTKEFLGVLIDDAAFIQKVATLVRWHMQILFVVKGLPFADIRTMKKQVDVKEVALLGLCDRLGRTDADRAEEERTIKIFLDRCGA
jgi:putative nucleotidyltransferase with HDIG domain